MPSKHQTGAGSGDYDSDEKRMLATKNDLTIAALIRGIRDPDRARTYIEAEVALADDEDRDARTDIIGALNRKIASLDGRDTGDTSADDDATNPPDEDDKPDTGGDGDE